MHIILSYIQTQIPTMSLNNTKDTTTTNRVRTRSTSSKSFSELIHLKTKKLSASFQQTVRQVLTPPPSLFSRNSPRNVISTSTNNNTKTKQNLEPRIIPDDREIKTAQIIYFGRSSELLRSLRRNEGIDESKNKLVQKYIVITKDTIEILNMNSKVNMEKDDKSKIKKEIHMEDIVIDLNNVHGISLPFRTIKSRQSESFNKSYTIKRLANFKNFNTKLWQYAMQW